MDTTIHESVIIARRRYVLKLVTRAAQQKLKGNEEAMMGLVADGFLRLGGVYVKFLQGVLLQLPSMRKWKNEKRFDVYEDVPPEPLDIRKLLFRSFPHEALAHIRSVNPTPFAAGSFGQVYYGELTTGQGIIIKALRPDARRALEKDLKLLRFVTRVLGNGLTNFNLNLKALTSEFVTATLKEIDYRAEVAFAKECYEINKDNPHIVVPKTYESLCSNYIITQDYVGGVSVAQLLRLPEDQRSPRIFQEKVRQATGSDLRTQLIVLGVELYSSTLLDRPLHGDPHPGNIRLLPDNKVGLLDFGIRARPSVSARAYYLMIKEWWRVEYANEPDPGAVFLSYIRFYSERLYASMRVISDYASRQMERPIHLDKYIAELGNKYFRQQVSDEQLQRTISDIKSGKGAGQSSVIRVINADNRFQIAAKIKDGPLLRSLVTYNSLLIGLGYRELIGEVYEGVMKFARENMPELEHEPAPTLALSEAMETLYEWLERIANNDYELYRQISSHLKGVTGLSKPPVK